MVSVGHNKKFPIVQYRARYDIFMSHHSKTFNFHSSGFDQQNLAFLRIFGEKYQQLHLIFIAEAIMFYLET